MYHSYWETLEFDIAAIVCVTVLMPLAISFMRMPKAKRAWVAAALLFCAMAYVGIFEGIRLHTPTNSFKFQLLGRRGSVARSANRMPFNVTYLPLTLVVGFLKKNIFNYASAMKKYTHDRYSDAVDDSGRVKPEFYTEDANTEDLPLIIHLAHHKTGIKWFRRVFSLFSSKSYLLHSSGPASGYNERHDIYQVLDPMPSVIKRFRKPFRAIFTVRDPRDVVIAGYFYHKVTDESWAHESRAEYRGLTLHEILNKVTFQEGVDIEIDRLNGDLHDEGYAGGFARAVREFARTDYEGAADIAFVKYEDLAKGHIQAYAAMGEWYGLKGERLQAFVDSALEATKEGFGDVGENQAIGNWEVHFTPANRKYFHFINGALVTSLQYEQDSSWVNALSRSEAAKLPHSRGRRLLQGLRRNAMPQRNSTM